VGLLSGSSTGVNSALQVHPRLRHFDSPVVLASFGHANAREKIVAYPL